MTSQLLGDATVAEVRDDDDLIKEIAEIAGLTIRVVRSRLGRQHGNTIVRHAFAAEWRPMVVEFGALTASAARELDAAARIASIVGTTRAGVARRLNAAHGAKLVRNVFAKDWPKEQEDEEEPEPAPNKPGSSTDDRSPATLSSTGEQQQNGPGPRVGAVINDRYRLTKVIGEGGFGVVFKAQDSFVRLQPDVALKFPKNWREPDCIEHEFNVTRRLAHANIVKYRHIDRDAVSGLPFLIMEYGGDSSLEALISESALAAAAAVEVIRQIAAALDHAHAEEIVHLDVNPSNILLDGARARLTDFGISGFASQQETTRGGFTMAADTLRGRHPAYSAPEVMAGERGTRRSDQFSLAAVFCAAVDGRLPRQPPSPRPRSALSDRQNAAVARALHVSSNGRFETVADFAIALGARTRG